MTVAQARARLDSIAAGWRRHQATKLATRTAALALPLSALNLVLTSSDAGRLVGVLAAVVVAGLVVLILPRAPRASISLVARHLDRTAPQLEDSATLLLERDRGLTTLERLQRARVTSALAEVGSDEVLPQRAWTSRAGELLAGLLAALTLVVVVDRYVDPTVARSRSLFSPTPATTFDPLAGLAIQVDPPTYTGRPSRTQAALDVEIEEGSLVTWQLPARDDLVVELITGLGVTDRLESADDTLTLSATPPESTVYRLVAYSEGEEVARSAFAHLQVEPDEPPILAVVSPAERLNEVTSEMNRLDVEIRASDDYGLASADLIVTLALGAGELVEFRERRIPLRLPDRSQKATLQHTFDLRELGVGPAAELYFHVEARDNREPEANIGRSPTTIVRVAGESAVTADLGEGLPVILPPTYFRSQRQIIIDTEKLIAERDRLPESEMRRRSETLGGDQRALRMRYGTLLGEEFVSGQAVEAGETEVEDDHEEHDGEAQPEEKVDSVFDVLPEGLTHEHDSAEMATFFASETRAKLKRVLGQMWDAEGRLRVIDPEGALPYEYQALELLKELQQASRVYVQKVGFEAPPLEPETRRLTGELDEILTRHADQALSPAPETEAAARRLLVLLDRPDAIDRAAATAEARLLRQPIAELVVRAPEMMAALEGVDAILDSRAPDETTRQSLQQALWVLVPAPDPVPERPVMTSDPLSRHYQELRTEEGGR